MDNWGKNNGEQSQRRTLEQRRTRRAFYSRGQGQGLQRAQGDLRQIGRRTVLSACFDPESLSYRAVWNGWIRFEPHRWGTSRNANVDEKPWFAIAKAEMPEAGEYLGLRRFGKRVVFEYRIGSVGIEDEAWGTKDALYRRIDLKDAGESLALPCRVMDDELKVQVVESKGVASARWSEGELEIQGFKKDAQLIVRVSKEKKPAGEKAVLAHLKAERKIEKRWKEVLKVPGELGKAKPGANYVVDTLKVPYDNPYKTVMQLSSMDFLPNGDAIVAALPGDIWLVRGISDDLKDVTWQRFATGFNQPIGVHIDEDGIFVLDRGQITILHDQNGDGEADHYEKYANDFGGYNRSHTHTFGLHRTKDGAFHFIQRTTIMRTGTDRTTEVIGTGMRNCMGIGGSDDYFWAAPQEGTWTPTSAIIEVNEGEEYGLGGKGISPPLCFVPRGIDNSTGG